MIRQSRVDMARKVAPEVEIEQPHNPLRADLRESVPLSFPPCISYGLGASDPVLEEERALIVDWQNFMHGSSSVARRLD